ncbi:MAG TPA: molybdopterin oxidoreductase family protein [Gammaproteobacteria bacterium]
MASTYRPSVCPHDCPSTCALEVEVLPGGRVGKLRGARGNDFTQGVICAKVARYAERVHHPERLTTPLRRLGPKGSGRFEPVDWDTALETLAGAFHEAAARHGPEAVWPYRYAGTMGVVQRDGLERLTHCLGYSRQLKTICASAIGAALQAGLGANRGTDPRETPESDLVVFWGCNAAATHVHALHLAKQARRRRGARIVVVDPYRNGTAAQADLHLALRPGTDGALACAVMHVLFRDGLADRDFLARHTDRPEALERHLASRDPAWAAALTGLEAGAIEAFAREYGSTARSLIRLGYGLSRSRNGVPNAHAVTCLPAVSGAWRHRGGGLLHGNGALYRLDTTLVEGLDRLDPAVRALDMSRLGAVLTGERRDLGDGPPVTAMLVQNTNPAAVAPESGRVRAGLLREDLFLCVHEQFLTDTARLADLVLPATTFLEHDDLYKGGGHVYLQVARALLPAYAESRSNHAVVCDLARRLGAAHPGFGMSAWELVDATLRDSGLPGADALYAAGGHDCSLPFAEAHFLTGFAHPDGRFRFSPEWAALGADHAALPELPDHVALIDAADATHPFRLVTAPAHDFLNTSFTETATSRRREGRPTALLHPDDCAALGLADGDPVRLGNRRGELALHARAFAGLQRGVVVVESIWPHDAFAGGIGINLLTSPDPAPPLGGAVFHDTAVWVRPA